MKKAPEHYSGTCPSKMKFVGMTPMEKSSVALRCGVEFPCVGACVQDFEASCPLGWDKDIDGWCIAGTGYTGPCVRLLLLQMLFFNAWRGPFTAVNFSPGAPETICWMVCDLFSFAREGAMKR